MAQVCSLLAPLSVAERGARLRGSGGELELAIASQADQAGAQMVAADPTDDTRGETADQSLEEESISVQTKRGSFRGLLMWSSGERPPSSRVNGASVVAFLG